MSTSSKARSPAQAHKITLSPAQARKIVLASQGVFKEKALGRGSDAVLQAIEHLGYIQIDTISVVERAHHHTLWNRVQAYQNNYLDQLLEQKTVYEYWSHAAAYLPMRDFKFSLPRKLGVQRRDHGYWNYQDKKMIKHVLERINAEGPLQARDFEHKALAKTKGWPEKKPAKKALDQLFMEGELMIVRREGFQKVYELTERALPSSVDVGFPTDEEYRQHLIFSYLRANGFGTAAQMAYLLKGIKPALQETCDHLLEEGRLISITVADQVYYALRSLEPLIEEGAFKSNSRKRVKILSPFDNLLIQRPRTKALFGFDYQIECYVPAAKRKYGYFCLPLLWGDQFAGRMDAKIDRKSGVLLIQSLYLESAKFSTSKLSASKEAQFKRALEISLKKFLAFNNGKTIEYRKP